MAYNRRRYGPDQRYEVARMWWRMQAIVWALFFLFILYDWICRNWQYLFRIMM